VCMCVSEVCVCVCERMSEDVCVCVCVSVCESVCVCRRCDDVEVHKSEEGAQLSFASPQHIPPGALHPAANSQFGVDVPSPTRFGHRARGSIAAPRRSVLISTGHVAVDAANTRPGGAPGQETGRHVLISAPPLRTVSGPAPAITVREFGPAPE
jgi:hypothetical protein